MRAMMFECCHAKVVRLVFFVVVRDYLGLALVP